MKYDYLALVCMGVGLIFFTTGFFTMKETSFGFFSVESTFGFLLMSQAYIIQLLSELKGVQ